MLKLDREIVSFFQRQGCVIVTTLDKEGFPHSSCKGLVRIEEEGFVYLFDAYRKKTIGNIHKNPLASITAFNEHKFKGYCLKGEAKIIPAGRLSRELLGDWEKRIAGRLTERLLKNMRDGKGHKGHPEAFLPRPRYMIVLKVTEIVDLTPANLK